MIRKKDDDAAPAEESAPAETTRAEIEARLLAARRPRTLGQTIDELGVKFAPGLEHVHRDAEKALVIVIGPSRKLPDVNQVNSYAAGDISPLEIVGLLECVKRDLLSERRQDEALRHALSGD